MKPTTHDLPARALALGLVAGAWVILSGMTPGVYAPLSAGIATAAPNVVLVAQAAAAPAMAPATYTADQADDGEKQFADHCVECHGEDLKGGLLGGASLRGLMFEQKFMYEGAPAGALFEVMSATMPPDAPGRYSKKIYADLMAYILKRNGFKAGAELPSDVDALYNLTIEK